ncbi:hypothetical protein [Pedobacter rhizosphaerae]|uniref:Uncharacterized protein n=1 Tax=Pedobacter rhizosphaerae TaxID=390241 RepID=A0A1H9RZE0_9SPHI|nr:hypothetical protein [Pedobacter rhizosphaerae]SER78028.1 hypothetical protein SAMN04488023_11647 [Pedobacter rhizosphaerae]
MKRLFLVATVVMVSLLSLSTRAQVNVSVNIGSQPLWGPTGYDHVDYYYLPDVESYYDVPKRQFVYLNGNDWVFANNLPSRYGNYDLYNGYKVVINSPRPYLNFRNDKVKYAKFKGNGKKQMVIRGSRESKYYVVKGHPHGMPPGQAKKLYGKGNKANGHGNGKGKHK